MGLFQDVGREQSAHFWLPQLKQGINEGGVFKLNEIRLIFILKYIYIKHT